MTQLHKQNFNPNYIEICTNIVGVYSALKLIYTNLNSKNVHGNKYR